MRRYWCEFNIIKEKIVEIEGDLFHHICDVCRQVVGNKFELISLDGKAFLVEVISLSKKSAQAKVLEERVIKPLSRPYINLCVSIPKFQKFEWILEKSVELGVKSVQPVLSDFSFIRSESKISENKKERWLKIVKSATQQCGRGELMSIEAAMKLPELFAKINLDSSTAGLFLYEGASSLDVKSAVSELSAQDLSEIYVFVGSEGGYSDLEVELFASEGLKPVTLGEQVLRVETACVSIVSVLKYGLNLMK